MKNALKIGFGLALTLSCAFMAGAQTEISRHNLTGIRKVEFKDSKIIVTDADNALVDYKIKGVCYSIDQYNLHLLDDIDTHIGRWKKLSVNSIRTFRPLAKYYRAGETGIRYDIEKTKAALDKIAAAGISVLVGFSNYHDIQGNAWEAGAKFEDLNEGVWFYSEPYKEYIAAFGNHPAILGFAMGNEYNYHYSDWFTNGGKSQWLSILKTASSEAKRLCPNKAVVVVHGEVPDDVEFDDYNAIPDLDGIFINVYRGQSFGNMFDQWKQRANGKMPLVVSEYGRSSLSGAGTNTADLQTRTVSSLSEELKSNFPNISAGAYVFSYIDEEWKGREELNSIIGSEAHLGLYNADGSIKPAGTAFANINFTASIQKINDSLSVYTSGKTLYVSTSSTSEAVNIYNASGALVNSLAVTADTPSQILLEQGVYIVKTGTAVRKAVICE